MSLTGVVSTIAIGATFGAVGGAMLTGNKTGAISGALFGAVMLPALVLLSPFTFASVGAWTLGIGFGGHALFSLTSGIAGLVTADQQSLEDWMGYNLFMRYVFGAVYAPISYVALLFGYIMQLDHTSEDAYPVIHNSWVPGMQQAVFGREEIISRMNDWKPLIETHFRNGSQDVIRYKEQVDFNKGRKSRLQGMLGTSKVGYIAQRQGQTVEITWYCYDTIDANSFEERKASGDQSLSTSHRMEAGADLIYDKIFQEWYNFRVSKKEIIQL